MKENNRYKLLFSLSMTIFGTIGVFSRVINLQSGEIALYRAVLASLFLLVVLAIKKRDRKKIEKRNLIILFLSGAAMGFNWIFLFEAYKLTSITSATLSYYFAPTIVLLLSPLLLKEKMDKRKLISFIVSTIGLILVLYSGSGERGSDIRGIIMGLIAASLYATVILLNKKITGTDGIERTFMQFLSAITVLLPYVLFTSGINVFSLDGRGWAALLVLGLFHTGLTYAIYFSSLPYLKGQEISILSYIDPLCAMIISSIILHEPTYITQIIGGVMILFGTLPINMGKDGEKKRNG